MVQIPGGLVGQQDPRPVGDGPGDGDPLLLAAGKPARPMARPLAQADQSQELGGPGPRLRPPLARDHLRQHDVLERRELGQQVVVLVDEAETRASQGRALAVAAPAAGRAGDNHLPRIRAFEQAGDVQERRLARARGADQGHDLAGPHLERDAAQHLKPRVSLAKGQGDAVERERDRVGRPGVG